ncbi:hypothetical protein CC1G_07939 [Coprinopsis cinerea okayama7|uniref:Protein MON2 homolog n=1 Tax=Coprinopsis cinerea (strain Okayama-7 / 130 / ATCC MYA-4618 / FGSC 9003) TaxID=240176 RepID=A8P1Y3_COPC7|nr:hypothetical protein CC1G_07939 [Coprinopsis cinerea okayama7\|eukprot:XP_001838198.2 hypothetical protein CC1G_07939 [Coprinopsis cinerea okayama7\
MGCATKNAKVVAISLGSLQRLITLKAVPQSAVPLIINTMSEAMSQGVDIQLRILQTLVSLIPNFPNIHDELLGDALLLCFKLQESRIAVVSSTAAATLRQLLMFVVDKMVNEDRILETEETPPFPLSEIKLPNGDTKLLGPSSKDAYSVFEDLCLLANSEKPRFLKLESLHKTFALELVESVLTNYHGLFRKHEEMILLLRHHLCPLLLKTVSERPIFPLILRCTRVIFLLLKQFSHELETEAEVFLMLLIKIITEDGSSESGISEAHFHHHVQGPKPTWMRVISMEIMRGICSDAELMRTIWRKYDAAEGGSKVFTSLLTALKRLLSEKPNLLGVSTHMGGVGVNPEGHGLESVAGRVASATVSGVVGMISSSHGLSVQGSSMKVQCIDQLDKADSPPIPESYIYLLAVQCIVSLCEGLASYAGPIYTTLVIQRPRAAGEAAVRAPPALDLSTLPPSEPQTINLQTVSDIITAGWPALLASLSLIIATNLSDELFVDVLASYQSITNVSGMLGLTTPRDAFLGSLAKFAVPPRVVAALDGYAEPPPTPRSATSAVAEGLGLGPAPPQPPGLSDKNMACLKVLVGLGESWYGVLETLQNADYVLTFKAGGGGAGKRASMAGASAGGGGGVLPPSRAISLSNSQSGGLSSGGGGGPRHPLLTDLDVETMLMAIQRLFDSSKNLEDGAFKAFVDALCKLSAEMVGMQAEGPHQGIVAVPSSDSIADGATLTVKSDASQRRRMSGMHIPKTQVQRTGDFGISKLGGVALTNIHRLIYRSPDVAWTTITTHLVHVIRLPLAPQAIRVQAARVLDEILQVVPRNISARDGGSGGGQLQSEVQRRVLEVLALQVVPDPENGYSGDTTTSVELRRMGLETLHVILQSSGHTLVVGWEVIFRMLESVCRPHHHLPRSGSLDSVSVSTKDKGGQHKVKPSLVLGLGNPSSKSYSALVKIAFQSLTLVCDSISLLSPEHLHLFIATLGHFGRQSDTNIALTATTSLLWSVSDAIQARRKNVDEEKEYSELWLVLLGEVLGLCGDGRAEVRDGAIQTLVRAMGLYGETLGGETWDRCVWGIVFPLLDAVTGRIRELGSAKEVGDGDDGRKEEPKQEVPGPGEEEADEAHRKSWDDSKILALNSIGSIFHDFLISKIMLLDSFGDAWDAFVTRIEDSVLLDDRSISAPALRCLEKAVKAAAGAEGVLRPRVGEVLERVWKAVDVLGSAVGHRAASSRTIGATGQAADDLEEKQREKRLQPEQPFTQESLIALVDVIQSARMVNGKLTGKEWELEKLVRLMAILKGVLTYPDSNDYRPDIDALPPLQAVVIETIQSIDLSVAGSPSLVMRDLSEYVTLAFLAAFDVQPQPNSKSTTPQKRVTYIALSKKVMPMLVELFMRFKSAPQVYADGTVEAVLSAYSVPIKLKYDCPAPSKFGKDQPLWKIATTCCLQIVKECTGSLKGLDGELSDERVEGIWWQILDVFRGAILADCSAAESLSLEAQEEEENFDLSVIASLEIDVIPHLGDPRVPDALVAQLSKILKQGSLLYESGEQAKRPSTADSARTHSSGKTDVTKVDSIENKYIDGTTDFDQEDSRRRLAALSLPSLLNRCRTTLVSYVADESLRGSLPFPRAREEELLYVLRKLHSLRLWPGSLWAAVSDDPTKYSSSQPSASELELSAPKDLIADSVKRSSVAHLFHFYPVLCEIASIPRRSPTGWISKSGTMLSAAERIGDLKPPGTRDVYEVDARSLARNCLKEIGKEMGVVQ